MKDIELEEFWFEVVLETGNYGTSVEKEDPVVAIFVSVS